MLRQVVMWKLKERVERNDKAKNISLTKELLLSLKGKVPQIRSISVNIDSEFPDNEDNHDIILEITLDDYKALGQYLEHPEHKKAAAFIGKVTEKRTSIDFLD